MLSQDHIDEQQKLLATHRATLAILLRQKAQHTEAYTPPAIEHGIREARADIRRIKEALRDWGETVEDYPNDEERISVAIQFNSQGTSNFQSFNPTTPTNSPLLQEN